jgi:hypothetical protein
MTIVKQSSIIHNNEKYDVWFSDSLIGCPALPLILTTYGELLKNNQATLSLPFRNNSMVVWLESNLEVVGGICFDYNREKQESWINLSFTAEEHRGKNINKICHGYFEDKSKKLGALTIGSIVAIDNVSRLKSAKKVGLEPKFYRMLKKL